MLEEKEAWIQISHSVPVNLAMILSRIVEERILQHGPVMSLIHSFDHVSPWNLLQGGQMPWAGEQ